MQTLHFEANPDMLATELEHYVCAEIPLALAGLICSRLGEPAIDNGHFSAWYATVTLKEDATSYEACLPFAMRITHTGRSQIQIRFADQYLFGDVAKALVPELTLFPIDRRRSQTDVKRAA